MGISQPEILLLFKGLLWEYSVERLIAFLNADLGEIDSKAVLDP